jgi:hypothetical protein
MAFSQATIDEVTLAYDGDSIRVSWTSSSPAGTVFQVYADAALAWSGAGRTAVIQSPTIDVPGLAHQTAAVRIDVGTVGVGEDDEDFSADLPTVAGTVNRVNLSWTGGAFEVTDPDKPPLAGFRVYGPTAPGGAVSYATVLGTVAYAPGGISQGGWGQGGWGQGGWGAGVETFSWTTGPLCPGSWTFAVKPFDEAGNEGTAVTATQVVAAAPQPPARNAAGKRLTYSNFHITAGQAYADLHWIAPASC